MKTKVHAREKRNEAIQKRKQQWGNPKQVPVKEIRSAPPARLLPAEENAELEAAEAREFLEYLEKDLTVIKDADEPGKKRQKRTTIRTINLELGMPAAEEAVRQMNLALQEMKISHVNVVRLIHGYGSTGRGGKIRTEVRDELKRLLRNRTISGFVTGEEFGPYSQTSRAMADRFPEIVKDPDYGRCNQGITIVEL